MQYRLTIELAPDTAAFLQYSQGQQGDPDPSAFINSLLRQERFRQGFPAHSHPGDPEIAAIPISRKYREHLPRI